MKIENNISNRSPEKNAFQMQQQNWCDLIPSYICKSEKRRKKQEHNIQEKNTKQEKH